MRGVVRTVIGFAAIAAGVLLASRGLYEVYRIGSCASGGPYVSARPCPPGTGGHIVSLIGGIFLAVFGAIVTPGATAKVVTWGLGFTGLGAAFIVSSFGPAAPQSVSDGMEVGGAITGGVFLLMGAPAIIGALLGGLRGGRTGGGGAGRAQHLLQHGKRCPGTVLSVADTGMLINDNPRVTMRIRAEPRDEASFEFEKTATVSRVKIPRAGDRCAVFYDPAGGGEPGVSFDTPALAMVGVADIAPEPVAPTPAASPAGDPIEELERLAKLHAAGALTDDEFAVAKARVLGDPAPG